MAIKTEWPVEHVCGHEEDHDLSEKRPSERAGYARWLTTKDCSGCWHATKDAESGTNNETWLAERRAEEADAIRTWELLSSAHDFHVANDTMSDEEYAARFEAPARTVTSASWWIDQRDTEPADLEELLTDVASDATARTQENPY
jgi:hypothetical protein